MPKKIMIIDDEPDIRIYLMSVLEDNGYDVCTVEDGESEVAAVRDEKPDLILLDIMMPGKSGISIYRDLSQSNEFSDIKIALISGMTQNDAFSERGFRKLIGDESIPPPVSFIDKPIQIGPFMDLIKTLLKESTE